MTDRPLCIVAPLIALLVNGVALAEAPVARCLERLAAAESGLVGPIFATDCVPAIPDPACRAAFDALAKADPATAVEKVTAVCKASLPPAVQARFDRWLDREAGALARQTGLAALLRGLETVVDPQRPGDLLTLAGLMMIQPIEKRVAPIRLPGAAAILIVEIDAAGRVRLTHDGAAVPCGGEPVCPDDEALSAAVALFTTHHLTTQLGAVLRAHPSTPYRRVVEVMDIVRRRIPQIVFDTGSLPRAEPPPVEPPPVEPGEPVWAAPSVIHCRTVAYWLLVVAQGAPPVCETLPEALSRSSEPAGLFTSTSARTVA